LVQNLTGKKFETVDYRNETFRKLFKEIYPNREQELITAFQEIDTMNQGLVKADQLYSVLKATVKSVSAVDLERFVRFLEPDSRGNFNYMEFLARVTDNQKSHQPFKVLVTRLNYFISNNKISVAVLLRKIGGSSSEQTSVPTISVQKFAEFLKQKVDKKSDLEHLLRMSRMIDIDKDNIVSELDITTCLKNLKNSAFW
jgi:Ca2+-binding EF-hand superfamily protein